MLDRIVPTGAVVHPDEQAAISKAVRGGSRNSPPARACARSALTYLGESPVSVPRGMRGGPQWLKGITSSITHCKGYRAAAVARLDDAASLRDRVAALAVREPGTYWDRHERRARRMRSSPRRIEGRLSQHGPGRRPGEPGAGDIARAHFWTPLHFTLVSLRDATKTYKHGLRPLIGRRRRADSSRPDGKSSRKSRCGQRRGRLVPDT